MKCSDATNVELYPMLGSEKCNVAIIAMQYAPRQSGGHRAVEGAAEFVLRA